MSSVVFSLRVPSEAPYRDLAGDVAARYLEVTGGSPAAVASFAAEMKRAVDSLSASGEAIDIEVRAEPTGLGVRVTSAGQSERFTAPLPVRG